MNEAINSYMEETLDFSSQTPAMQAALTKFFESALGQYVLSKDLGDMFSPYYRRGEAKPVAPRFFQASFPANIGEYSVKITECGEDAVKYSFIELCNNGIVMATSHDGMTEDAFYTKCQQLLNKLVPTPVLDKQTASKLPDLNRPGVSKVMRDTITRLANTPFGRYAVKTENCSFRTAYMPDGDPIENGFLTFGFVVVTGEHLLTFNVCNGPDSYTASADCVWLSYSFGKALGDGRNTYWSYQAGSPVDEDTMTLKMKHAYDIIVNNWIIEQHAEVNNELSENTIEAIVEFLHTPLGQYCFTNDLCEFTYVYYSKYEHAPAFLSKIQAGKTVYRFTIKNKSDGKPCIDYAKLDQDALTVVTDSQRDISPSYFNDLCTLVLHSVGKHSTNVTTADYI